MSDKTKIEWTEATWNPVRARRRSDGLVGWHCEHASPGCKNCYSETRNKSGRCNLGTKLPFKPGHRKDVEIFIDERTLTQPLRWKRARQIFVCSMTDLFADFVTDEMLDRVFAVMALCPQHTFQVLTKRSARMREYLSRPGAEVRIGIEAVGMVLSVVAANPKSTLGRGVMAKATDINPGALVNWPLPHVWLGVSVEDQQRADERIPDLLATPAAVRWLSCEPLLGPVDLTSIVRGDWDGERQSTNALAGAWQVQDGDHFRCGTCHKLDWIVAGGESGPGARPMHPDWARSLRDQCAAAGVPFFMKQLSSGGPRAIKNIDDFPADLRIREFPRAA